MLCDSAFIQNKFGISPMQYADFKALTGDSSDNIKGAKKIGPKTASELLRQFGSLEAIIKNANEIKRLSIRESINQNAQRLRNNYCLIKLNKNAQMPFSLEQLNYKYDGITTNQVLTKIGLK